MQLEIGLTGADEALVRSLYDWIEQERIEGTRVEPKAESPLPGRLGVDISAVLSVVLSARAVVALVKCLHAWAVQHISVRACARPDRNVRPTCPPACGAAALPRTPTICYCPSPRPAPVLSAAENRTHDRL